MSADYEWVKIVGSLIGGGLAGAVLNNTVTAYRNRVQPIGRRIELASLFTPGFTGSALRPTVTVSDGATTYQFANLYVADVQIVNRGNRDYSTFSFGLTLADGDTCVHVESLTADRHHFATLPVAVTPANPSRVFDAVLRPFNRADVYTFKVFIVSSGAMPGSVEVSSSDPVRFVDIPTLAETLSEIAVKVGPLVVKRAF